MQVRGVTIEKTKETTKRFEEVLIIILKKSVGKKAIREGNKERGS